MATEVLAHPQWHWSRGFGRNHAVLVGIRFFFLRRITSWSRGFGCGHAVLAAKSRGFGRSAFPAYKLKHGCGLKSPASIYIQTALQHNTPGHRKATARGRGAEPLRASVGSLEWHRQRSRNINTASRGSGGRRATTCTPMPPGPSPEPCGGFLEA